MYLALSVLCGQLIRSQQEWLVFHTGLPCCDPQKPPWPLHKASLPFENVVCTVSSHITQSNRPPPHPFSGGRIHNMCKDAAEKTDSVVSRAKEQDSCLWAFWGDWGLYGKCDVHVEYTSAFWEIKQPTNSMWKSLLKRKGNQCICPT